MAAISKIDWDILHARVNDTMLRHNLPNTSTALLWLALGQYFPDLDDGLVEAITDGADDRGVDAIHVVERDAHAEVFLFQSKYRESVKGTDRTINDSEALKLTLFLEELFDKADSLRNGGNFRLRQSVERIWMLHEQGTLCKYRVVFCSNDQGLSESARQILKSVCDKHNQISYEHHGTASFIREFGVQANQRETGYLQVIGKEAFERIDGDIRGVIASIDANSFVDLIQTDDGQSVKRYLFDENLRVFLGANGGFNPAIIATAASDDSHLFWYLNNGITITCRDYTYNKGHANPKIRLDDFQIVNGAQTSHSLIEARKIRPEAIENVVLMVRIYATARSDIAERVAVATNSQARIQSRDLRANHPTLKKLEMALAERGYYFERKRNMHADKSANKRIDALKLGQILLTYYSLEPDRAKGDSDTIFEHRFHFIFHESLDVDDVCRLFEMYQIIEAMREEYISNNSLHVESGGDLQYLIYGHWFVLYAARQLILRRHVEIPAGDAARALILEAIGLVSRACGQQKVVAHYQMFRSSRTKDKILAELEGKQGELFEHAEV